MNSLLFESLMHSEQGFEMMQVRVLIEVIRMAVVGISMLMLPEHRIAE